MLSLGTGLGPLTFAQALDRTLEQHGIGNDGRRT
jgi:hypothetical protein